MKAVSICLGLGVDSVGMICEWIKRRLDPPDLITFADTGGEKFDTYLYMPILRQFLRDHDWPQPVVCRYKTMDSTPYDTLYGNMIHNETMPSIVFGGKSCSVKWKIEAQEPI